MKLSVVGASLAGALMAATSASAAVPLISGTYALTFTEQCQAVVTYTKDGSGKVTAINSPVSGEIESQTALVVFNATTHIAAGSGRQMRGDLLIVATNGPGQLPADTPWVINSAYTNTATTFTLLGKTFRVQYGNVVSNVARYVTFDAIVSTHCIGTGTAVHQ